MHQGHDQNWRQKSIKTSRKTYTYNPSTTLPLTDIHWKKKKLTEPLKWANSWRVFYNTLKWTIKLTFKHYLWVFSVRPVGWLIPIFCCCFFNHFVFVIFIIITPPRYSHNNNLTLKSGLLFFYLKKQRLTAIKSWPMSQWLGVPDSREPQPWPP